MKPMKAICFIAIAFQLCYGICHQEGSGIPGGLEIKRHTSVLFYAHDVNILSGSVHAIKKNTEALVVASKEIGLEVNAEETKYMVMSRPQHAGKKNNIK
jgi:hypothetical protein